LSVIVAPPGTGKTIIGLKIIADKQQPALIIVHRKQLAEQWIERIQSFLGIPKNEIGSIGQGKSKTGKKITIALIQSLSRMLESANQNGLTNKFGTNTELDVPFNSKTDKFETLSKVLVHDSARNKLILKDVISELTSGKKVVIITERKEHLDSLNQYLKQSYETIVLSGDDPESSRTMKWKMLKDGSFQALITTGQFFGEGTDIQNIDRLFLVYPFSFQGKLIQYIGRVQRSEIAPVINDYRDIRIDYLNKLFLKRNTWYRKLEKQASLFDEPEPDFLLTENTLSIEDTITIAIDDLEFRYGSIAFRYHADKINQDLEFEIENDQIRPEFVC